MPTANRVRKHKAKHSVNITEQDVELKLSKELSPALGTSMLNSMQIYVDVWVALLDAITDTFKVSRDDLEVETVPSEKPIEADQGGWRLCLKTFERYIHSTPERGSLYRGYTHKERHVDATLQKNLDETADYLRHEIVKLLTGAAR